MLTLSSILYETLSETTSFTPAVSTLVKSIDYEPGQQTLTIAFKKSGAVYQYSGVPDAIIQKIKLAPRPGKAFYDIVRDDPQAYPYVKLK